MIWVSAKISKPDLRYKLFSSYNAWNRQKED